MSRTPEPRASNGTAPAYVLRGATLVTCDAKDRVLRADLLIENGRIARIGRIGPVHAARSIDATDRAILPGLIMAHVHLCQALMRGMADDLPLLDWLEQRIWPLEAAHDDASLTASAELGLCELLRAGTTAILDLGTSHGQDAIFEACARIGLRVAGGRALMDTGTRVPRRLKQTTRENLRDAERLERTWNGHAEGKIRYVWSPRFVLSCSEALIRGSVERAESAGALFHTHASEHAQERRAVRQQFGTDDVLLLERWGARGSRVSFAHGVQLTDAQIRRLARSGTHLVSCPSANLKLGSGVARLARMCASGLNVALGADGAPCNNNLDPWLEMRHAALLASLVSGPGALPARAILRMATIGGARVLGLDAEVGSIEIGKRADLVVVRLNELHAAPALDPIGTLVYATQARDVEHVFIDGRPRVYASELVGLDAERVVSEARRQARKLLVRARI